MSLAVPIGSALLYLDTSEGSPRESFASRRGL
jgi:hypothetical protein